MARWTPLIAIALATPVLAGCLTSLDEDLTPTGAGAGAAGLSCIDGVCNFEATVDPDEGRQANELSIAVNPTDPLNIIATGKDYTPEYAGECVWDGLYVTKDGGNTWKNMNVPGSPWKRLQDPSEPVTEFSKFWCATDPVVAFGPDGTAYWTVMPYQCDRFSGSKTGRGVHPDGGFNDWLWTCSAMYVLVSEDGGETWPLWREVAFGPRLEHDKQWMSVAPDGTVLLCWDRSAVTGQPMRSPVQGLPQWPAPRYPDDKMVCSASTDKGRSWTPPEVVNERWAGWTPAVAWGPDDRAYLVATADDGIPATPEQIIVARSDDGIAWDAPRVVGTYRMPPRGGDYGWPVLWGSDFRVVQAPSIAVDTSDGPYRGRIYVVWFDHAEQEGNALFSYSADGGRSWSKAARVHDDDPSLHADQWMPAVSVGPDGTVDVEWYDRRNDPENHLFDLYYTYSLDGGETFAPNVRVSDVSSDEQWSHHQNGMVFLGDYLDIDSSRGAAHVVWVDTRNEKADVFTATVERPGASP